MTRVENSSKPSTSTGASQPRTGRISSIPDRGGPVEEKEGPYPVKQKKSHTSYVDSLELAVHITNYPEGRLTEEHSEPDKGDPDGQNHGDSQ
jgi:hypothetical protein